MTLYYCFQESDEDGVPGEDEGSDDEEGSDEDGTYKFTLAWYFSICSRTKFMYCTGNN